MDGLIQTERKDSADEIRVQFHERLGPFGQGSPDALDKVGPAKEPAKEFTPRALVTEANSGLTHWRLFRAAPDFEIGIRSNRPICAAVWHFSSEFPEAQSRLAQRVRARGQDG
jgi:hypothetical protein